MREGRADKGQGIGYLPDGTMVIVSNGQPHIGQQVEAHVQRRLCRPARACWVFAEARNVELPNETGHHVATNFNPGEAELTRSRLEAAGFHPCHRQRGNGRRLSSKCGNSTATLLGDPGKCRMTKPVVPGNSLDTPVE